MHVAAIGDGYVGIGTTEDDADQPGSRAVWTSADGIEWTVVSGSFGIFEPKGWVLSMVIWDGTLWAGGYVWVPNDEGRLTGEITAAIWRSPDGPTWEKVDIDSRLATMSNVSKLMVGGPGLVAVGGTYAGVVVVGATADGLSWEYGPDDDMFYNAEAMTAAAFGNQLVLLGTHEWVWTPAD